jgi:hypothetical protein
MTGSGVAGSNDVDRARALLQVLVDELEASVMSLDSTEQSLDDLLDGGGLDAHTARVMRGVREEVGGNLMLTEHSREEVVRVLADLD